MTLIYVCGFVAVLLTLVEDLPSFRGTPWYVLVFGFLFVAAMWPVVLLLAVGSWILAVGSWILDALRRDRG